LARLILDSGAVVALARRDPTARAFVERAVSQRDLVVVPAVVIAETTRGGGQDAPVNQVIKAVNQVTPATERTARQAGRLLGKSWRRGMTVDALVAAEAIAQGPAVVLTGDPKDISELVQEHLHVRVHRV
jgi:predicted nucleic acid-binding protein